MDRDAFNGISLWAGGGGLDLAVGLAFGDARTVCYVEREAYACAVLAARMEEDALAAAPVWTDGATFDGRAWRECVDWISAGYPCQPFSTAGKRLGSADPRDMWPDTRRIIGEVGPRYVFLENVAGHLVRGFDRTLGELAEDGYDAVWTTVRASDVGAPHRRERLFCLAHRVGERGAGAEQQAGGGAEPDAVRRSKELADAERVVGGPGPGGRGVREGDPAVDDAGCSERGKGESGKHQSDGDDPGRDQTPSGPVESGEAVGHTERSRREATGERRDEHAGGEPEAGRGGVADAERPRLEGRSGERGDDAEERAAVERDGREMGESRCQRDQGSAPGVAEQRSGRGSASRGASARDATFRAGGAPPLFPPGPDDHAAWAELLATCPDLEPALRRDADGLACRVERLRMLGNGVVPLQGAYALRTLWALAFGPD